VATEIIMPTVSNSMTEGVLARWVKKEGEAVSKGEVVAEIETDKAIVELEAEAEGVIGKLFVVDGATVQVGVPMGVILEGGEPLPQKKADAAKPDLAKPLTGAASTAPVAVRAAGTRVFASPLARSLALLHDLDLSHINGSGPNGRIVKRDIEAAVATPATAMPVDASRSVARPPGATPASATRTTESRDRPEPRVVPAPATAGEFEDIPHTPMRRVIAQRLSESKQQVPHFYLTIDCRLDALLALREQINGTLSDTRISVNDFIVKAVAGALKKVPAANASWTESAIRRWRNVDISVAVATPNGLLTPIVRNADAKSLGTVSAEIKNLAERARNGKLLPNDYQGGGFTISNLGMHGIREFAAIINPPQACILAVGAGEQRAVIRDGAVAAATVMSCTLSVDHRVVDGAIGAEFLAAFKVLIESPLAMLV
jgi:pyruvate dehydrogenase E2 component (dihydrolipoamide acetyltransferase)